MRTSADKIKEKKHEYLVLKKYKGVNTQPSREAIPEDEFAWLENMMPSGDAFLQAVPQLGGATATVTSSILSMHFATIGTTNYQICFTVAGGAQAVDLGTGNVATIAAGGTFTTPSMDQWKSERIVIGDVTNGYFSWDGSLFYQPGSMATISVTTAGSAYTSTPTVVLTGGTAGTTASANAVLLSGGLSSINLVTLGSGYTAAPAVSFSGGTTATVGLATASAYIMPTGQNANATCVYSGRVWLALNRTLTFTAPNTWFDFASADAAGSSTITEGSLRQRIYGLEALDNYMYVFGDSSIIIIGDLKVTGSITTFSQTFLSSTTGSTLPATITAMERAILFVNKYGVYALFGASVQKVSRGLDGVFPLIDFTQNVSAGLVQIYNQQCYAFSFTYQGTNGNRQIQALLLDGKWFFTSQQGAANQNYLSLPGTSGNYVSTPDSANLDLARVNFYAYINPDTWTPASTQTICGKWTAAGNQRSYRFSILNTGFLQVSISTDGTLANVVTATSTSAIGLPDGTGAWINISFSGATASFLFSTDPVSGTPFGFSINVSYTSIGSGVAFAGTAFVSTAPFEIGSTDAGTLSNFKGKIYRLYIRSTFSTTAYFNANDANTGSVSFVSVETGETYTVNQSGSPSASIATTTTTPASLNFIAPASINGVLSLWGTTGTDVRPLYADTTTTIATTIQTGLQDLGNPIFDKQANRAGIEFSAPSVASVNLQMDTEQTSEVQTIQSGSTLTWYNASGGQITWLNANGNTITWIATGFLQKSGFFDVVGKYLGFTVTSNTPQLVVNGLLCEYEVRASWGP